LGVMAKNMQFICNSLLSILLIFLSSCSSIRNYHKTFKGNLMFTQGNTFHYNDISINYYEYGEGKPIIFIHGFGGASYSWRFIYKSFTESHKVFLIDLKGFGFSDKPREDKYSISDQADIIESFIIKKNLSNIILVGHSMGGAVALYTYFKLNKDINRLKGLILIDSAGYNQRLPYFINILRIPIVNILSLSFTPSEFAVKNVLRLSFYAENKITDEMIKSYAFFQSLPGAHYALIKTAKQIIPKDVDNVIMNFMQIKLPVLLIWGQNDNVIPMQYGRKMNSDMPYSRLKVIPECGHIPHEEKPNDVISEINNFLIDINRKKVGQ